METTTGTYIIWKIHWRKLHHLKDCGGSSKQSFLTTILVLLKSDMVSLQESRNHHQQRSCPPPSRPFSPQATPEAHEMDNVESSKAGYFPDPETIFNVPRSCSSVDSGAGVRAVSLSGPCSHHYKTSFEELELKFRSLQHENHSLRQRLRQGKTQFSLLLESLHEQEQHRRVYEDEFEEFRSMVDEANAQTVDVLEENYSLKTELKHLSDPNEQKHIRRKTGVCASDLYHQKLSSQPYCISPLDRQLLFTRRQTSRSPASTPPPLTPDLPEVESPTFAASPPPPSDSRSANPPEYFPQQTERSSRVLDTTDSEASIEPMLCRRNAISISDESDIASSLHELSLRFNSHPSEPSPQQTSWGTEESIQPASPPFAEGWRHNSGNLERICEEDEAGVRYAR